MSSAVREGNELESGIFYLVKVYSELSSLLELREMASRFIMYSSGLCLGW
jgi:hypothetical protein